MRGRLNVNIHHPPDYSAVPQDNMILEYYGINELNFESIKRYRGEFSAINPNHPWNGLEIKDFLYKIGAWGKVRNTNKEGLTLAGLVMFSEERIITEVLPQFFLEYREDFGEIMDENWSKRFTSQDGTWSGNVFDFYFKVNADLMANFHEFYQNAGFPVIDETSALFCLHESLINALVHADYHGEGGITIEKKADLFQFSNPGLLRVPLEQALEGNVSNLRNPNLFKMFILIGLCKRTGSRLKSIKTIWGNYEGNEPFHLMQEPELERTILKLHLKQNVLEKEAVGETEEDPFFISKEEEQIMSNIDDIGSSYNKEGSSVNNKTNSFNNEGNSYNRILDSCNNGVNSMSNGSNSYNKIIDSYNKESNSFNNEDVFDKDSISPLDDISNSYNNGEEIDVEEQTTIIESQLDIEPYEEEIIEDLSKEVEETLWEISELARRKKRLAPSVMEEIIVNLCRQKPLMLRELAHLLARTPDGLRNNYLAKLLDKGKIKLKYPDQPNHPKQAYIIARR